jgi:4-alpha-glucanotransferase
VRIDHFRGLVAYWEIPAEAETAREGEWIDAPVYPLFQAIRSALPAAQLIAEDLGDIDPPVREALAKLGLPGMKILQFAFDEFVDRNPYVPHCHTEHSVVYTGTHDNNTLRGWFEREASWEVRERLMLYLGQHVTADSVAWQMIRLALSSVATIAVLPMQDFLGAGADARMNVPGVASGNWTWRFRWEWVNPDSCRRIAKLNWIYGRTHSPR